MMRKERRLQQDLTLKLADFSRDFSREFYGFIAVEFYRFLHSRIAKNCSLFITNGNVFLTLRNLDATTSRIESSKYERLIFL